MAIFHVSHKTVGRSTHAAGTAGAHADYIEREKACRIAFGEHMPTRRGETRRWLDEQEAGDRKNARVIDKLTLALPLELDAHQRVELVRAFVEELSEGKPVPWLAAIHDNEQDADNPHCHLIIRDRHVETGKRAIGMSEKGSTERARETWERAANTFLLQAGSNERIDRRSLKAQRAELLAEEPKCRKYQPELADEMLARAEALDRKPQGHEGPQSREIERKGRHSEKLDRIRNARQGVTETPQPSQGVTEASLPSQGVTEASLPSQGVTEASLPSQGVTEASLPSQGVTIRSKEDRLRRRREKQNQQRVQLERTLDNGPEPNDPPLWGSVREAFKDIISPAGWRGALWQVLAHFKLVGDWVELDEINDELREQAASKFEAKPQSIRQKILSALNLPLEPQKNEPTPQKPMPEKLEKPEQPKPRPKSGWSGPSGP